MRVMPQSPKCMLWYGLSTMFKRESAKLQGGLTKATGSSLGRRVQKPCGRQLGRAEWGRRLAEETACAKRSCRISRMERKVGRPGKTQEGAEG